MRKEHAIHNEKACDFLLESGKYNDWAVTAAFYSALHYLSNEIFPFEEYATNYDGFDRYLRSKYELI